MWKKISDILHKLMTTPKTKPKPKPNPRSHRRG